MGKTITIDERRFQSVAEKARAVGKSPEQYLEALIDADTRTFAQVLQPIRQGFESMTDEELDALFDRASKAARARE